jgi:hypothetical protein
LCKILAAHEVKPHKARYYLQRRDPKFVEKMAEILCVYREVALLNQAAQARGGEESGEEAREIAILSYNEKPGIQALAAKRPTCRPSPCGIQPSPAITNTFVWGRSAC